MGRSVRPRKSLQRPASARSRATTRRLGGGKSKRGPTGTEVSGAVVVLNRKQTMGWR